MSLEVKDIMVKDVITVEVDATVREAAKLMYEHELGCLIVTKRGEPCWNSNRKRHTKKGFT